MVSSDSVIAPHTPAEAYSAYRTVASSVLVAGAQELKRKGAHYKLAIELNHAGLSYIRDRGEEIAVGAMTTMAEIEKSPLLKELAGDAICASLRDVPDRELKQHATLGGLIASKQPFSVLLPVLLSLTVDVVLEDKGRMELRDYLSCPPMGELITEIVIAREFVYTAYMAYRSEAGQQPYLTGAVTMGEHQWRIVVGGRPGVAAIAENASEELSAKGLQARENVAHMVSEELDFENFGPCSEQERRNLTIDMMRILIKKAWKGFSRQNSLTTKPVKK